jgi:1-acyl-sn-glycerol-3-phosphate acyltransferase
MLLKLRGWKVEGDYSGAKKSCIIIVAPHTSQWDFVWGLLARSSYGIKAKYLIKKSFFKPGIAWFFRWTGGIPVDRSKKNDLTKTLKSWLEQGKELKIVFTPEGTRSKSERWKTGFYWTALDTGLPIIMQSMDYKKRVIAQSELLYPTGDWEEDKKKIIEFYKDVTAKHPSKFSVKL